MKLIKSIQVMGGITALALIYIHMQMQIFDMAYQGKKKQKEIEDLSTSNGVVAYNIMKLTSSNNLGYKLLSEKSDLKFRAQENVVELAAANSPGQEKSRLSKRDTGKGFLLGFLSVRSEAEARPVESKPVPVSWGR